MIGDICAELNNYFVQNIMVGKYAITDGTIELDDYLQDGQYFRIVGSVFNDGVYTYPATDLTDETFFGAIWAMSVPPSFIALCSKVDKWCKSDAAEVSPYTSESFGGYSYTRATDSSGAPATWREIFAKDLNKYRRASIL